MLANARSSVTLAFDENNISNVESAGGALTPDGELREVNGDPQWMQDPFEAAKNLSKGEYAMTQQPDGWLVAIDLGSAVNGIESQDVAKSTSDELTSTRVLRADGRLVSRQTSISTRG